MQLHTTGFALKPVVYVSKVSNCLQSTALSKRSIPRTRWALESKVVFPNDLLRRAYERDTVLHENIRPAVAVLEQPKRIFSGLRELNEGWWCYVGRPETWCVAENRFEPFPAKKVFTVCLNDRMWVFDWVAERADAEDELSPVGWQNRFTALVWKIDS